MAYAISVLALGGLPAHAQAVTFGTDYFDGEINTTLTTGLGMRTESPDPDLINRGNVGGPAGRANPNVMGDQGDLNYAKHDLFTQYIKGTHELLLKFPEEYTFMARVNWLYDFAATDTTGWASNQTLTGSSPGTIKEGLPADSREDLRFKYRLMDLWVSKRFSIGDQQARLRVGNQVINWGETVFALGGLNQTNAVDLMRLSQPGTQIKEALLPAPIVSFATGLGSGLNVEAYVQQGYNKSYFPPTGSYWSVGNGLGTGDNGYGLVTKNARSSGQWGLSLRFEPESIPASFGVYVMRYHDKTPNLSLDVQRNGTYSEAGWVYLEDRMLYGVSVNTNVGDWAVGSELSYRPKDAVSLNSASGCADHGGQCWTEEKRWQWSMSGTLSLTPANARGFLDLIGADTGNLISEIAVIHYPDLKKAYGSDLTAPGFWSWGNETDASAAPKSEGTKTSSGISLDFSVTYDGSIIPGWQVTPEIFYSRALQGRTPSFMANYMKDAQSANFMLTFSQNPLTWMFGVNYARYWGGDSRFDQPIGDRDFVGAYLSYNF
ncbi:DUF1302 domain-containing protein [Pseudomonas sp. LRF_L74]|uniref:DUF1302 domain-containing protein n=1 Tax=Pseudomonas sp. LRF_L74 TaxID=3369422 RepID=UPI003F5FC55D